MLRPVTFRYVAHGLGEDFDRTLVGQPQSVIGLEGRIVSSNIASVTMLLF